MARGRKKKTTTNLTATGIQYLGYQGIVNVNIMHGDAIILNKTYHNSGMPELFRFLANCLAGNISNSLKPMKIRLFDYPYLRNHPTDTSLYPSSFSWTTRYNDLEEITPFISYDSTPVINCVGSGDNAYYEVTYHFNVPFAYLAGTNVYAIGFFTNNVIGNSTPSAYYLFTKKDTNDTLVWDPLLLSDAVGDYNLIINWTLAIKNQTEAVLSSPVNQ